MLINFPVMNKQQVSMLSFLLLLSLALESLVDRWQTLIKKISKQLNCLFGRTKRMALDIISPERDLRKDVTISKFSYIT